MPKCRGFVPNLAAFSDVAAHSRGINEGKLRHLVCLIIFITSAKSQVPSTIGYENKEGGHLCPSVAPKFLKA